MKTMFYRIKNAFKIGYWAFKNPKTLHENNFKMLSDVLKLILKVAEEQRPMMLHIGYIHPEDSTSHSIVSIWAGAGLGAEPTKRIKELLEENARLKMELARYVGYEGKKLKEQDNGK